MTSSITRMTGARIGSNGWFSGDWRRLADRDISRSRPCRRRRCSWRTSCLRSMAPCTGHTLRPATGTFSTAQTTQLSYNTRKICLTSAGILCGPAPTACALQP